MRTPGESVNPFRHSVEENKAQAYDSNIFENLEKRDIGRRQEKIQVLRKG